MRENYKILFIIIITILSLSKIVSTTQIGGIEQVDDIEDTQKIKRNKKSEQRGITEQKIIINPNIRDKMPQNIVVFANFLIDSNQELFLNNKNIKLLEVTETFENNSLLNFFALGIDALINIIIKNVDNNCRIDFICYSSPTSIVFEDNISFVIKDNINDIIQDEKINIDSKIKDIFSNIELKLFEKRQKITYIAHKKIKVDRDFPIFNISMSGITLNMYMDARSSTKIFAFSPIDIKATFYPIKHLEVGTFISFDIDNTVYRYYNKQKSEYEYFNSFFNFLYGFHIGGTFFYNRFIYGLGIRFYNILYTLINTDYKKPNSVNGYFLPSFDFYQKLDIRIFKFLYYSLFVNIKLLPLFELDENNYFYSAPFSYDFINISISLVGLSISM